MSFIFIALEFHPDSARAPVRGADASPWCKRGTAWATSERTFAQAKRLEKIRIKCSDSPQEDAPAKGAPEQMHPERAYLPAHPGGEAGGIAPAAEAGAARRDQVCAPPTVRRGT
ncbi:hypothetical protein [Zoogloea sp.]|uniref:hypothetical protein n=1 Tax=Zoogloea sp. TaxID=49181 RepID=UPI0035AE3757